MQSGAAKLPQLGDAVIAVIGLGYVGLPLAAEFGKHFPTIGFDTKSQRVEELRGGHDHTREVSTGDLEAATKLTFTDRAADIEAANVYIVAVPTPIDEYKRPDLQALLGATETVAGVIKPGDVVIYESTVYPGATDDDCVPLLERLSGLRVNHSFYVGYSPERINPGDPEHRLTNIRKVTSGSTREAAAFVDALYGRIISVGTHCAPSIRVAEAAKVIENTQRDLNIALMNELAMIFNMMDIDTEAVLAAAGTKWNFLPFRPGLVGGHCIGVDPYYLTHKAQSLGYHPEIILAGRRLNDSMGEYIATRLIKCMLQRQISVNAARILVLGLTFKENCPDLRNTRVVDLVGELQSCGMRVDVCDPLASPDEAKREYGIATTQAPAEGAYDAVVLAVAHDQFREMGEADIRRFGKPLHILYDLKHVLPTGGSDLRL